MADNGTNRRQRAAAAREASNAGEKRRERTVRLVGGATVLLVVAGIIGLAVFARSSDTGPEVVTASADPSAPLPKGARPAGDPYEFGIAYGTAPAGAPVLEVWEDFQCPSCGAVEAANGDGIAQLAEDGKITLVWRPTTFLDKNLGNDSSLRAVAAWGCAADAGKAREYHDIVYANQPLTEGDGFPEDRLIAFGAEAGITGADTEAFTKCIQDGTYLPWAANSTQVFYDAGIPGTPLAKLDGTEIPTEKLADKAALDQVIADALAAK
jgi:protein-disulfide isomerase